MLSITIVCCLISLQTWVLHQSKLGIILSTVSSLAQPQDYNRKELVHLSTRSCCDVWESINVGLREWFPSSDDTFPIIRTFHCWGGQRHQRHWTLTGEHVFCLYQCQSSISTQPSQPCFSCFLLISRNHSLFLNRKDRRIVKWSQETKQTFHLLPTLKIILFLDLISSDLNNIYWKAFVENFLFFSRWQTRCIVPSSVKFSGLNWGRWLCFQCTSYCSILSPPGLTRCLCNYFMIGILRNPSFSWHSMIGTKRFSSCEYFPYFLTSSFSSCWKYYPIYKWLMIFLVTSFLLTLVKLLQLLFCFIK